MPDAAGFALHRPELTATLMRGDEKIARLMAQEQRTFSARTTIIPAEAEHAFVYRLRTGWAGRVRTLPDGRSQFILVFLPGDLFAVKSMFVSIHPDAVEALSDVSVDKIDHRKLREAFETDPDVAERCIWQVVEEERRLHNWVVGLGQGSAEERLAQTLLEFRVRLTRAGVIEEDQNEFRLPMTQDQLGDLLGITMVHVNRILRRFREDGIAVLKGGIARLLDMPTLERIAFPLQDPSERNAAEDESRR